MLRIFGHYNNTSTNKTLFTKMSEVFEIPGNRTEYIYYSNKRLSLIFECLRGKESKNYYKIDNEKQIACFITGNIHANDNYCLKHLTGEDVATFIIGEYCKDGFGFTKHLRGHFNITLIDNNKVFIVNDPLGLSPMYTYQTKDGFFFCTEPEPIIWLKINNRINFNSLSEFIVYGLVPNGKTFIKGLNNQEPGTIIDLSNPPICCKKYFDFTPMNVQKMTEREKFISTKNILKESIQIRVNEKHNDIFIDLSGGWDTRFILANIISLNKKPIAYTKCENHEDLLISQIITKQMNLKHIIQNFPTDLGDNPRLFLDLTFRKKQIQSFFTKNKKAFHDCFEHLTSSNFFASSKFTGLFGTELLGNIPQWFEERNNYNFNDICKMFFSRNFLKKTLSNKNNATPFICPKTSNNPILFFLTQVSRTYLYTHSAGWERPTNFFRHQSLIPFTDLKFIRMLCSFEYNTYIRRYKMYEILFKAFYPEYLKVPWTFCPFRIENNLKNQTKTTLSSKHSNNSLFLKNKAFLNFLKQKTFVNDKKAISSRIQELFFLYNWLETYKTALNSSDINFALAKTQSS